MRTKYVLASIATILPAMGWLLLTAGPAHAEKPIKDQFKAKYVRPESGDPKQAALARAFQAASCGVCHVGDDKKQRNAYGRELAKLLGHKDVKDSRKTQDALDKVASQKSDPADPNSPTFGEKIAQGKLPAAP